MRLLQQQANGDTDFSLVEFIDDIPPYAILSHTWGADHEEVVFKDIYKGKGKGRAKPGYEKLRFCAQRATEDQIGYFWTFLDGPGTLKEMEFLLRRFLEADGSRVVGRFRNYWRLER
ncbi:unnamed protein product [Alternaria alternata]